MPCSEWLISDTRTRFHEMNRSGWWFISFAIGVSCFTESTDTEKSSNLNSRRSELPYFSQSPFSSPRRLWTSSSVKTVTSVPLVRIASLVPSATETLFALGLGDDVVAVTHECDYPPEAQELPHLTRSVIEEGLGAA